MQLTKTIFSDSAVYIEKKTVENRLLKKKSFVGKNACIMRHHRRHEHLVLYCIKGLLYDMVCNITC